MNPTINAWELDGQRHMSNCTATVSTATSTPPEDICRRSTRFDVGPEHGTIEVMRSILHLHPSDSALLSPRMDLLTLPRLNSTPFTPRMMARAEAWNAQWSGCGKLMQRQRARTVDYPYAWLVSSLTGTDDLIVGLHHTRPQT